MLVNSSWDKAEGERCFKCSWLACRPGAIELHYGGELIRWLEIWSEGTFDCL